MLQVVVPLAAAIGAGWLFLSRGKANIGDTVDVLWKPGGQFGEQGITVQGKVTAKTNPVVGPYYSVQLFQIPKVPIDKDNFPFLATNPDIAPSVASVIPSTLDGIKDVDIIRNVTRGK